MICASKRAFWNEVAREILRPVAKFIPILLNIAQSVKATEKVYKHLKKTMDHSTQNFDPTMEHSKGLAGRRNDTFRYIKMVFWG